MNYISYVWWNMFIHICASEINVVPLWNILFCSFWQCVLIFLYNIRAYVDNRVYSFSMSFQHLSLTVFSHEKWIFYFVPFKFYVIFRYLSFVQRKKNIKSMTGKYEIKFFLWIIIFYIYFSIITWNIIFSIFLISL